MQRLARSATPEVVRTDVDVEADEGVDVDVDRMKRMRGSTWSTRDRTGDVTDER